MNALKPLESLVFPLLEWYRENARDLPWRHTRDPYRIWVSEIMLQQTRVVAVLDYYRRFFELFPTILDLAQAPEDQLMKCWQGLGYYSRARNLQKAAKAIVSDYNGVFPAQYEDIRSLPGIGDYTAGAISSIAFGLPRAAVDGNVLRVVSRVSGSTDNIDLPGTKKRITQELEDVIPLHDPGDLNQALMELGATVCLPNSEPLCPVCPLKGQCLAKKQDKIAQIPVRSPKRPRRVEELEVYLVFQKGAVGVRKRLQKGLLEGLWEFPNGAPQVTPGWWNGHQGVFGRSARHIFTHVEWHMTGWLIFLSPHDPPPEGLVWATREELQTRYSIPNAFSAFLDLAMQNLDKGEN